MKRIITAFLLQILVFSLTTNVLGAAANKNNSKTIEKKFQKELTIRVEFLSENILRIQIGPEGEKFEGSGLNRYGFILDVDGAGEDIKIVESAHGFSAKTPDLQLKVSESKGEILVTDASGKEILLHQTAADFLDRFSKVSFDADKNEDWIGFGDQTRERIYHRGYIADCKVRNVESYAPVPFYMSTRGVGVLVNTTHRVVFDMCKTSTDTYFWDDYSGTIDYYVMVGEGFGELIDSYTELTGKPKLPPEWSFGLWYICNTNGDCFEAVNDALNFRREEIPCDVIGLEPGWMKIFYDESVDKSWSEERFHIPSYSFYGEYNFLNAIFRMGYKMELWLCNDYDLSYEEDRRIGRINVAQDESNITKGQSEDGFEVDEHLNYPLYADKITKKDEPWFEHLEKFVDQGISFFKQDGASQISDHPDRLWGNGMLDAEMHNLYPLLYSRQMYEGLESQTNLRPVVFTPCGWAGFQAWSGTWTGDTGGRIKTLCAMMNTSIVGHSWATCDMEVTQKEGIHFGYLQPWSQINSWNYFRAPWIQGAELSEMHKYYSRFRARLIPYIYSWGYKATQTGWPVLLPLTLEFPDDKNCRDNLNEYLLGRDLLVSIYQNDVYFPAGSWKDYWTGEVVEGKQEVTVTWPDDRGGALYVRSGGIIPFGPVMQYRGEKAMDKIDLYIFPDEKESAFDFYEDDGVSFKHLDGEHAITQITTQKTEAGSIVNIGASEGDFEGKVKNRSWSIVMHMDSEPKSVSCNDTVLLGGKYSWDENRKELTISDITAPAIVVAK